MKGRSHFGALLLAAGLLILLAACNPAQPAEDAVTFSDENGDDRESTQAQGTSSPTKSAALVPTGMELVGCPGRYGLILLKFSADVDFNVEEVSVHHSLGDGVLLLEVSEDQPRVLLQAQSPITLPVTIQGGMEDCTLSGESSMIASASGYCENGIVRLIIEENWQSGSGVLSCPERDPVTFPIAGAGSMIHRGADGHGEVFYLDANFSEHNVGYMLEKPFSGQGGSGTHTWTLVMDPIQPVQPVSPP